MRRVVIHYGLIASLQISVIITICLTMFIRANHTVLVALYLFFVLNKYNTSLVSVGEKVYFNVALDLS